MFERPGAEDPNNRPNRVDEDCSAELLKDLLPEKTEQPAGGTKEERATLADKLIDQADKELQDINILPVNVRAAYIQAHAIQEDLYGKTDERLLPVVDRLAHLSPPKEALKYKEQSIEILNTNPSKNHVSLALRYTDLGNCYKSIGDESKSQKYSQLAQSLWQEKAPPESPESQGDIHLKRGDRQMALRFYAIGLEQVEKQVNDFADSKVNKTNFLHANPLEIRLNEKLGDSYRSLDNFESAASSYARTNDLMKAYSATHNDNKILPSQLSLIAKSLEVEFQLCHLASNNLKDADWRSNPVLADHLAKSSSLFNQLTSLESITKVNQPIIINNEQDDHKLFDFIDKVAHYNLDRRNFDTAAKIFGRLYNLQTAKNESPLSRLMTLNALGQAAYNAGDNEKALETFSQAINLAGDNPSLWKMLSPPPEFIKDLTKEENLANEQLYALAKHLIKAANKLSTDPSQETESIKYLESTILVFKQCLKKQVFLEPEILSEMTNAMNTLKRSKNPVIALLDIQTELNELARQLSKHK